MDLVHFYHKQFTWLRVYANLSLLFLFITFISFSRITSNVWMIVFSSVSSPDVVSSPHWQDPHISFSVRESSGTTICPQLALSRWHVHSVFCCEVAERKWWKDLSLENWFCTRFGSVNFGWWLYCFRSFRVVYLFRYLRYVKGKTAKYAFACSIDLVIR